MGIQGEEGGNELVQPQGPVQPDAPGPVQPDARIQEFRRIVEEICFGLVFLLHRQQDLRPDRTMAEIREGVRRRYRPPVYPNIGIYRRGRTSCIFSVRVALSRSRLQKLGARITRAIENDRPMSVRKQERAEAALLKKFENITIEYFGPGILDTFVRISGVVIEHALGFEPDSIEELAQQPGRLEHALRRAESVSIFVNAVVKHMPRIRIMHM